MPRISLTPPRTLLLRIGSWYSRRTYGKVLDPGQAYGHHSRVLFSYVRLEQQAAKWNALDAGLKHLAVMAAAARINCSWCMDFGYWEGHELGVPAEKIEQVPRWREARGVFTDLELLVMEYAEAMTETEPHGHGRARGGTDRAARRGGVRRAHRDGRPGELALARQQRLRPDQSGLRGGLPDPGPTVTPTMTA